MESAPNVLGVARARLAKMEVIGQRVCHNAVRSAFLLLYSNSRLNCGHNDVVCLSMCMCVCVCAALSATSTCFVHYVHDDADATPSVSRVPPLWKVSVQFIFY